MIYPQTYLLTGLLMLVSGTAMAFDGPTDKSIIELYCDKGKGEFVNTNGKTTLECEADSDRYFFEKTNAKLGLDNKDSLINKPYNPPSENWDKVALEYLLEQKFSDGRVCSKIEFVKNLPVFRCNPKDFEWTAIDFQGYLTAFRGLYLKGATSFKNDAQKIELGPYLVAKDTSATMSRIALHAGNYKDYFLKPDQTTKFPGWERFTDTEFRSGTFNPRFWTTPPALRHLPQPATYNHSPNRTTDPYNLGGTTPLTLAEIKRLAAKSAAFARGPTPAATEAVTPATDPKTPVTIDTPDKKEEVVTTTPDQEDEKSCQDKLSLALSKLLDSDKQNIIGQQYELTVLKMAAMVKSEEKKSLEALIKNKSSLIAKMDSGIIDQMNEVYKNYGLAEDAQAISQHLKKKAQIANYFQKDKRFFNQDSSAFLLAFQKLNPTSGIKDTDVSILWFMEKVSMKAQTGKQGKYSAMANRTNLSTRIAQYTGYIRAKKSYDKDELIAMAAQQKKELDAELSSFIESFKKDNEACYKELFIEGKEDCHISVVENSLSQLLAVQSKIPSTDLITLDEHLKGDIKSNVSELKTRFQIDRFANEEAAPSED